MITIMTMTWKEMLRKRVMLLTLLMTVVFLTAFWFIARGLAHGFMQGMVKVDPNSMEYLIATYTTGAILLALGFFFGSFVIAFLSIFSSFSAIAGEAEQGVLQALLPRPIKRWQWFMGRWLGYVSLGVGYAALMFGSILLITRMHAKIPSDALSLTMSFLLFALVVPLLISAAMLGSCRFSALGNGVFMTMLFGAGWLGGMIEKLATLGFHFEPAVKNTLMNIAGIMSLLMPADAIQRRMLAEMFNLSEFQGFVDLNNTLGPFSIGQAPSNVFLVYAVFYTLAALAAGILLFKRKDF